jgi:Gpi18-like mannosyltransferase
LLAFCITRVGIALVVYVATPVLPDPVDPPRSYLRPDNTLLDVFGSRWDAGLYRSIAVDGYRYSDGALPTVAFFPLLPIAMRLLTPLTGNVLDAGLLVTNSALLLSVMLLYRLVAREWDDATADRTVWYLLLFPTSFFGSANYSESLFLLCSVAALYAARCQRWFSATVAGVLATLSRPVGVLVAPLLLVEWWTQRRRNPQTGRPPLIAALASVDALIGLFAYMVYLQIKFDDPLAFLHAQAYWGRTQRSPLSLVGDLFKLPPDGWSAALPAGRVPINAWIDALCVLLFIVLGVVLLRWRRWSEAAFVLLGTFIVINSGAWISQRRHVWVLFPAFVVLARWGEQRWVDRLITVVFLLGLGLFTAMFANWYWVA